MLRYGEHIWTPKLQNGQHISQLGTDNTTQLQVTEKKVRCRSPWPCTAPWTSTPPVPIQPPILKCKIGQHTRVLPMLNSQGGKVHPPSQHCNVLDLGHSHNSYSQIKTITQPRHQAMACTSFLGLPNSSLGGCLHHINARKGLWCTTGHLPAQWPQ